MSSITQDKHAARLQGGLELLLAAVHADDPKRELLVRIGDLMRDAAALPAFRRCPGCDGHECIIECKYPGAIPSPPADMEGAVAVLRTAFCPGGGWTGMPDDVEPTIDACLKAGVCGCDLGAAVTALQRTDIAPLDLAWEQINALGGTVSEYDDFGRGCNHAVGQALDIIETLGGADPAQKRALLADKHGGE